MEINEALIDLEIPSSDYCILEDSNNCLVVYHPKKALKDDLPVSLIEHTLGKMPIDDVHIICFGNRLYGGLLPSIWEKYPGINTKIMICSPQAESIAYNTQYFTRASLALGKQLKKVIEHNGCTSNKTDLHVIQTPSTLRACVLYSKKMPVLCCYQRYEITTEKIRGKQHTPCFIAYKKDSGNNYILNSLARSIDDEFKAMKKSEVSVALSKEGELVYG